MSDTPAETAGSGQADPLAAERAYLAELEAKPFASRLFGYAKLSGPGWLQSALTLGGGSLASGLYLGVLGGFGLLWLQPLAMILGIAMLSAIGYVTLSTGERPFRLINRKINPALGWSWLIASMLANMVWSLPQYALAIGVVQQNLLPGVFGPEGSLAPTEPGGFDAATWSIVAAILVITTTVTWSYGSGHWGVKVYELSLKLLVAAIVLCFLGVVGRLAMSSEGFDFGAILAGFVPDFTTLTRPAPAFRPLLDSIAETAPAAAAYWTESIVGQQQDVVMGAFATAVGINMTFLLPYSMLGRGWRGEHRGLAVVDLSTGMFVPFLLATSCVVIASASQFHGVADPAIVEAALEGEGPAASLLEGRDRALGESAVPTSDDERRLAAMLVKRDTGDLSASLEPLLGRGLADVAFGLGVLGMALSTISLLMLVSGFVVCELLDVPASGWPMRLGSLAACTGALAPIVWAGKAKAYLAVPTSVFGLVLLPIAYVTFWLLINSRSVLGDDRPGGAKGLAINLLLAVATTAAVFGSGWAMINKIGPTNAAVVAVVAVAVLAVGTAVRSDAADAPEGE